MKISKTKKKSHNTSVSVWGYKIVDNNRVNAAVLTAIYGSALSSVLERECAVHARIKWKSAIGICVSFYDVYWSKNRKFHLTRWRFLKFIAVATSKVKNKRRYTDIDKTFFFF